MMSGFSYAGGTPRIPRSAVRPGYSAATVAGYALVALLLIALFGRIMSYPLQHDEQIHVAAGAMVAGHALYHDLGYNHLPNLALTLSGLFALTGGSDYLLVGRLAVFAWWLVACSAIALIAWRATGSRAIVVFAIVMLVSNPVLLGQPGLLVTNSFAPIALALLGTYFFLSALDGPAPGAWRIALAGICIALAIGFRVSYIFLLPPFVAAALLVPARLSFAARLRTVTLPFALAGVVGMLPTLIYLASDPQSLFAHTVSYFTGPHKIYWQTIDVPKVVSLAGKVQLAEEIWFSGTTLLSAVAAGIVVALTGFRASGGAWALPMIAWPVRLMAGLIVCGMIVSFVPTPAFAQYYAPPIIFLTLAAVLGFGALDDWRRQVALVLLALIAALSLASGATRLGQGLAALPGPGQWAGMEAHASGARITALLDRAPADGKIATLSPIFALEAGHPVYPELAAGPFQYRVADLIPPADRRHYRIVSPRELPAFLEKDPPVAIITGQEGDLDAPFEAFARSHGYRMFEIAGEEPVRLFVQPAPVSSTPAG